MLPPDAEAEVREQREQRALQQRAALHTHPIATTAEGAGGAEKEGLPAPREVFRQEFDKPAAPLRVFTSKLDLTPS